MLTPTVLEMRRMTEKLCRQALEAYSLYDAAYDDGYTPMSSGVDGVHDAVESKQKERCRSACTKAYLDLQKAYKLADHAHKSLYNLWRHETPVFEDASWCSHCFEDVPAGIVLKQELCPSCYEYRRQYSKLPSQAVLDKRFAKRDAKEMVNNDNS